MSDDITVWVLGGFLFFFPSKCSPSPTGGSKSDVGVGQALNFTQPHTTSKARRSRVYHEDAVPAELKRGNTRESLCEGQKIIFTTKQSDCDYLGLA